MKTNEVKACVTQQLRRLQVLPEPQRRAELAELRRGVGRQPGDLPALWGALLADMPEQLQGSNGPSKAEWAVYTALTLFALHQQGEAGVSMNQPGRTLGGAVRQLAEKTAAGQDWTESSVLRRFNALATADSMPEVSHHLRGMIQLLRREVGDKIGIKASGGIRERAQVQQFIAAGATRIGTSAGVLIAGGEKPAEDNA